MVNCLAKRTGDKSLVFTKYRRRKRDATATYLKLQTSVNEIKPFGAIDIHGCPQHFLWKTLPYPQIRSAHCKVAKRNLNMQWHSDHVADHQEYKSVPGSWDPLVHHPIPEPAPENDIPQNLEPSMPPCGPFPRSKATDKILPAKAVEIETTEGENDVVEVGLIAYKESGNSVIGHNVTIEGRT